MQGAVCVYCPGATLSLWAQSSGSLGGRVRLDRGSLRLATGLVVISCLSALACLSAIFPGILGEREVRGGSRQCVLGTVCGCVCAVCV